MDNVLMLGKLRPIETEWEVAASTPLLELSVREGFDLTVSFIACFGLTAENDVTAADKMTVGVVQGEPMIDSEDMTGRYQKIVFTLKGEGWAKYNLSHSDDQVIDYEAYDLAFLPWLNGSLDSARFLSFFQKKWQETGLCPDPGVYQVVDSSWVAELGLDKNANTHFIFCGHDSSVEVVVRQAVWRSVGSVRGW